jgi:hypothetical protein
MIEIDTWLRAEPWSKTGIRDDTLDADPEKRSPGGLTPLLVNC